jgi:hypothetical protein
MIYLNLFFIVTLLPFEEDNHIIDAKKTQGIVEQESLFQGALTYAGVGALVGSWGNISNNTKALKNIFANLNETQYGNTSTSLINNKMFSYGVVGLGLYALDRFGFGSFLNDALGSLSIISKHLAKGLRDTLDDYMHPIVSWLPKKIINLIFVDGAELGLPAFLMLKYPQYTIPVISMLGVAKVVSKVITSEDANETIAHVGLLLSDIRKKYYLYQNQGEKVFNKFFDKLQIFIIRDDKKEYGSDDDNNIIIDNINYNDKNNSIGSIHKKLKTLKDNLLDKVDSDQFKKYFLLQEKFDVNNKNYIIDIHQYLNNLKKDLVFDNLVYLSILWVFEKFYKEIINTLTNKIKENLNSEQYKNMKLYFYIKAQQVNLLLKLFEFSKNLKMVNSLIYNVLHFSNKFNKDNVKPSALLLGSIGLTFLVSMKTKQIYDEEKRLFKKSVLEEGHGLIPEQKKLIIEKMKKIQELKEKQKQGFKIDFQTNKNIDQEITILNNDIKTLEENAEYNDRWWVKTNTSKNVLHTIVSIDKNNRLNQLDKEIYNLANDKVRQYRKKKERNYIDTMNQEDYYYEYVADFKKDKEEKINDLKNQSQISPDQTEISGETQKRIDTINNMSRQEFYKKYPLSQFNINDLRQYNKKNPQDRIKLDNQEKKEIEDERKIIDSSIINARHGVLLLKKLLEDPLNESTIKKLQQRYLYSPVLIEKKQPDGTLIKEIDKDDIKKAIEERTKLINERLDLLTDNTSNQLLHNINTKENEEASGKTLINKFKNIFFLNKK